jgi:hypothetical protein
MTMLQQRPSPDPSPSTAGQKDTATRESDHASEIDAPRHVECRCSEPGSVARLRTSIPSRVTSQTETIRIELGGGLMPDYSELLQLRELTRALGCRDITVTIACDNRGAQRMLELAGLASRTEP